MPPRVGAPAPPGAPFFVVFAAFFFLSFVSLFALFLYDAVSSSCRRFPCWPPALPRRPPPAAAHVRALRRAGGALFAAHSVQAPGARAGWTAPVTKKSVSFSHPCGTFSQQEVVVHSNVFFVLRRAFQAARVGRPRKTDEKLHHRGN